MSWLFKDPINSGLAQFDHVQSSSKKWPKGYKDQIAPNYFFSQKTNKIFMYLLTPFIVQNFKKILGANPELWGCAILGPKMTHLSWTKFFWYKPLLLLSSTYWPFSLCKIKKNSDSRSYGRSSGAMEQWPSGWGTGFPIQGYRVQNYRVALWSTQAFILLRFIKGVPGISGNLVVKSKLPPRSGTSLEAVAPHP